MWRWWGDDEGNVPFLSGRIYRMGIILGTIERNLPEHGIYALVIPFETVFKQVGDTMRLPAILL